MVNLGFVRDFKSCPKELPRIFLFSAAQGHAPLQLFSYLYQDVRIWELHYYVSPDKPAKVWATDLAKCLIKLRVREWCLNVFDLVNIFHLPLSQAMLKWGAIFWPEYNVDAIVYIPVREDKEIINKEVLRWEKSFTHLVLRSKYDLTLKPEDEEKTYQDKKALGLFKVSNLKFRWRRKWL